MSDADVIRSLLARIDSKHQEAAAREAAEASEQQARLAAVQGWRDEFLQQAEAALSGFREGGLGVSRNRAGVTVGYHLDQWRHGCLGEIRFGSLLRPEEFSTSPIEDAAAVSIRSETSLGFEIFRMEVDGGERRWVAVSARRQGISRKPALPQPSRFVECTPGRIRRIVVDRVTDDIVAVRLEEPPVEAFRRLVRQALEGLAD